MVAFDDNEYLCYIGDLSQNVCDEYILVASKGLSEKIIKQRIKAGEIKTGESYEKYKPRIKQYYEENKDKIS